MFTTSRIADQLIQGYKPYHLKSVMLNRSHASAWRAVAEHHMEAAEVIEMIHHDGFDATMDNPMCELVECLGAKGKTSSLGLKGKPDRQTY